MSEDARALEQGMTYVEKLDFREQEHRHAMELQVAKEAAETKRAKLRRSEARQDTLKWVGIAALAAAAFVALVYFIWLGTSGPEPTLPTSEERRETACIESGGGWVPEDLLEDTAEHGICVHPGVTP